MNKLKVTAVTLAAVGILEVGAGLPAQQTNGDGAGERVGEREQPAVKGVAPRDPAIKALIEARLATAREVFEHEMARLEQTLPLYIPGGLVGLVASLEGRAGASQAQAGRQHCRYSGLR